MKHARSCLQRTAKLDFFPQFNCFILNLVFQTVSKVMKIVSILKLKGEYQVINIFKNNCFTKGKEIKQI